MALVLANRGPPRLAAFPLRGRPARAVREVGVSVAGGARLPRAGQRGRRVADSRWTLSGAWAHHPGASGSPPRPHREPRHSSRRRGADSPGPLRLRLGLCPAARGWGAPRHPQPGLPPRGRGDRWQGTLASLDRGSAVRRRSVAGSGTGMGTQEARPGSAESRREGPRAAEGGAGSEWPPAARGAAHQPTLPPGLRATLDPGPRPRRGGRAAALSTGARAEGAGRRRCAHVPRTPPESINRVEAGREARPDRPSPWEGRRVWVGGGLEARSPRHLWPGFTWIWGHSPTPHQGRCPCAFTWPKTHLSSFSGRPLPGSPPSGPRVQGRRVQPQPKSGEVSEGRR
ncbi:uncharacterized protein LOC124110143 [Marmota monax]|uniref:uncharacterized protein LOC124110143 n=1 Tax=Marmota monax TaxID=9995 RepID=UPI001EB00E9B|nr:uncharacterized protein LOC124110143 [Marmota monax]